MFTKNHEVDPDFIKTLKTIQEAPESVMGYRSVKFDDLPQGYRNYIDDVDRALMAKPNAIFIDEDTLVAVLIPRFNTTGRIDSLNPEQLEYLRNKNFLKEIQFTDDSVKLKLKKPKGM